MGFGWVTAVPRPEPLQHPPGASGAHPSLTTPNLEQGGLRCSEGQAAQMVEVGRGCPIKSHLKINTFQVASSDPLCGTGVCISRLGLSTSITDAPQTPWQQHLWEGLPSSGQPHGELHPPPNFSPAELSTPQTPLHPPLLVPGGISELSCLQKPPSRIKCSGENGHSLHKPCFVGKKKAKRAVMRSAGRASRS